MTAAVSVEHLGKRYRLGAGVITDTLRESVMARLRHPLRTPAARGDAIWALQDVSFEVATGEVLGLIGRNGAGKSTLLKILSRITRPTTGRAELGGRVGSLLEVGTGFHPELTGRENIYLSGSILGMPRSEVKRQFDAIVDFAEVGRFIDTPVKRYSSGMYLRLGFAVAAHLAPDILMVDEVLAVGDAIFQARCLSKMNDASREGRTVLFVSHNLGAIGRLCSRAILLDSGRIAAQGSAQAVVSEYLAAIEPVQTSRSWPDGAAAPGDGFIRLLSVALLNERLEPATAIHQNEAFHVDVVYAVRQPMRSAHVGFELRAQDGTPVLTSYDSDPLEGHHRGRVPGVYHARCRIPGTFLNEGIYRLGFAAGVPFTVLSFRIDDILSLTVNAPVLPVGPLGRMGAPRAGVIAPEMDWTLAFRDSLAAPREVPWDPAAAEGNGPASVERCP